MKKKYTQTQQDDDIVFEEDDVSAENLSGGFQKKLTQLKEKLHSCEAQKQEYLDSWQRAQADFANLRKRDEEDKKRIRKFAEESLMLELLPVLDTFELALSTDASANANWRKGIEQTRSQLESILKKHGLTVIDSFDQLFDPLVHEAVSTIPTTSESEDHIITEVLQTGYTLHDKVIRHAKVKIKQYQSVV